MNKVIERTGREWIVLVKNIDDIRMLQDDLDRLYEWSEKWQMQFNVNKCSIMSIGKGNRPVDYTLNDTTLGPPRGIYLDVGGSLHVHQGPTR